MKYQIEINGIEVDAVYSEETIREILLPLLKRIEGLYEKKQGRILVMLSAPPGAGKSTFVSFLRHLSLEQGMHPVTAIGMDGFHRYQEELLKRKILRDGKEYSMVEVKGCPETFDLEKLLERVKKVAAGENCTWPEYNRMTHNPMEDAIRIDGDIILLEGNYLLLDRPGWKEMKNFADLTISIRAEEKMLRDRLIDRKIKSGNSPEMAKQFVDFSDMYN
nr:nucleoside/nucleotide kinase family protein [Lachnospiraceae bacterium]